MDTLASLAFLKIKEEYWVVGLIRSELETSVYFMIEENDKCELNIDIFGKNLLRGEKQNVLIITIEFRGGF